MKDYIKDLLQRFGLRLSLLFIAILISSNAVLVIYYRSVMVRSSETSNQIQVITDGLNTIENHIHLGDLGVRAYLIKPTDEFLAPYVTARNEYHDNLDNLNLNLEAIGYDLAMMTPAVNAIIEYMDVLKLIVDLSNEGQKDEALEIFYEDKGYTAWQRYAPFLEDANAFIEDLSAKSQNEYKNSINLILFIQILLIVISVPIVVMAYRKIKRDGVFRNRIFNLIDSSNRNYLFDDGKSEEEQNEDTIAESLISNLKKASSFINSITKGNYNIEWEGLDGKIQDKNKGNVAGELVMMRDQMQKAKQEDDIRIWMNEGLSNFADLIRKHQNNLSELSEHLIANIVEYLGAQQGGLFFASEDDHQVTYLEMMGCFAYERKKFMEKRIELGQGMVGQCFLEGETSYLTNIPDEYVNITSGLGKTNPSALLIVPLKINEEVVGVVEIASVKEIEKYKIGFVERLAETIASAISTVKTNESTRVLLEQSQQQSEEMRAQEEEMRQNMEELQATQEQMHRKNEEVENLLKQSSENEESMRLQMEALSELQAEMTKSTDQVKQEAEDYRTMMMDILNEIPQKIFLKDGQGKMYLANQKVADAHGIPLSELIGKSDYDFVDKKTADAWRKQELEIIDKGEEKYVFEDTIGGKKTILESTKKVFNIRPLSQKGLLGIQNDITEKVELQDELKKLKKGGAA